MPILRLQGTQEQAKGIYYEVDSDSKPIGKGGMGMVCRGRQVNEKTGATREVAIKFLYDDLNVKTVEKARREAAIQLHNDNLVEMLGFFEIENRDILGYSHKSYHVVSELLHGVSLSDVMKGKTTDFEGCEVTFAKEKQREYESNPLEFARCIVHQVLLGLIALHNAGYIHRDIDPSNIMLTSDRKVKLIDFGIAKKIDDLTQTDASHTQEGKMTGKVEYASPELVEGRIKEQDQRSDIYAMGMLLYTCIVGHPPFSLEQPYGLDLADVLEKQVHTNVPMRQIHNKEMRNIIRKATQKKRERRYQSTAEMMVALEQLPRPLMPETVSIEWKNVLAVTALIAVTAGAGFTARQLLKDQSDIPPKPIVEIMPKPSEKYPYQDKLDSALAALEQGQQFVSDYQDIINEEHGRGELSFLIAFKNLSDIPNDANTPDSIQMVIKTAKEEAIGKLQMFRSQLNELRQAPVRKVSERANERVIHIDSIVDSYQNKMRER